MKKINVIYTGWGERWLLGTLADTAKAFCLMYSPDAIQRGLQLS
ncbi:MAG: type II toxin-antitoxin system HipA family toxin, partial [Gammaproteobacteria bacterium]|nr:type II toxin-antitoxin system HipA family toxin [Gammaproteobacteria bacterium]